MQLRMSPGGSMPNSRRNSPELPPSSVTVTMAPRLSIDQVPALPTKVLRPRSRVERPVPPPMVTMFRPWRIVCGAADPAARRSPPGRRRHTLLLFQFGENQLGDGFQRVENAGAVHRHGFERRLAFEVELAIQLVGGDRRRQVALVELQRVRNRLQLVALLLEVLLQVLQRLDVRFHARLLRVSDKDHAVDAFQDQLARGVVEDLARNGVEMEARFETANRAEVEREEVEEERAIRFRRERDQLAFRLRVRLVIDPLQVRGLAAETGTVIHDLAVDLARRVVDERHWLFAEQAVDVLVRDLSERRVETVCQVAAIRFGFFQQLLERFFELAGSLFHSEPHEAERRLFIEDDDEDHPLRDE